MAGGPDHDDAALLAHLGALAEVVDPAPALAYEMGRAALAWRTAEAELAELAADSGLDQMTVRASTSATRLLSFEAGSVSVEVQVSPQDGSYRLRGQVIPEPAGPGGVVRVETNDAPGPASPLDELGRFLLDGVTGPMVRLRVERPGEAPVATVWVRL